MTRWKRPARGLAAIAAVSALALAGCADDDGTNEFDFDTTDPTDGATTTMPPGQGFDQPGPQDDPGDGPMLQEDPMMDDPMMEGDGTMDGTGEPDAGAL